MTKKQRAKAVCDLLIEEYKDAKCSLDYKTPLELLIAVRLSAQCTDKRVNIVTKELFSRYKTVEEYSNADITELENIIKPCGFFRDKAKSIKEFSAQIISEFDGEIPNTMEGLLSLSGIGRKTANLILGELFNEPSVVVADTHCIRISNKIGLADSKEPKKVEYQLRELLPPEKSLSFCHCLVWHGREICIARRPKCAECVIKEYCKSYEKANNIS
ncbi:MAG: endonuclease III [Ruminococcaceae bacterium]|nr:endonuclease III [Oscillospiraceae bacterium]